MLFVCWIEQESHCHQEWISSTFLNSHRENKQGGSLCEEPHWIGCWFCAYEKCITF